MDRLGRWKMAFAKKTSSSCMPASGRKSRPREKNRRGRIAAYHLNPVKFGGAAIGGRAPEEGTTGRGIITSPKVISIHQRAGRSPWSMWGGHAGTLGAVTLGAVTLEQLRGGHPGAYGAVTLEHCDAVPPEHVGRSLTLEHVGRSPRLSVGPRPTPASARRPGRIQQQVPGLSERSRGGQCVTKVGFKRLFAVGHKCLGALGRYESNVRG